MTKKERALNAVEVLKKEYPEAVCSLNYSNPFELLVAVRLSAQCTDARVNLVTPALFEKYKTLDDYCSADVKDIEKIIYSCGFYKSKAESIIDMAKGVRERFGGIVPDNIDDLITLNGVGRKTANLIVGDIYHKQAIVVDTHMIRIANRIGLVSEKDPICSKKTYSGRGKFGLLPQNCFIRQRHLPCKKAEMRRLSHGF